MVGNIPAMSDLLMAKFIWVAKAVGLIFRNFMLLSLKPLDDELLDFLMMFTTTPTVMGGILKTPFGAGMRLCKKISGLKNIAIKPTLIFCIWTFQNFMIEAILVVARVTRPLSIRVDGVDIFEAPVTVFMKFQTFLG